MTGIPIGQTLKIVLMLWLSFPKITNLRKLCDHGAGPNTACIHLRNGLLGNRFLRLVKIIDRRSIGQSAIIALPVQRGWIMNLKEKF